MNLEDTIYFGCAAYSMLHPNRASELDHLFCVNGNGYEWENGELVSVSDSFVYKNGRPRSLKSAISNVFRLRLASDKARKKHERDYKRRQKRNPVEWNTVVATGLDKLIEDALAARKALQEKDPVEYERRRAAEKKEWTKTKRKWAEERKWAYRVPADIKKRVKCTEGFNRWYPICQYSALMTFPDNIKSDWLNGVIEVCNLIIANPPQARVSYDDPGGVHSKNECLRTMELAIGSLQRAVKIQRSRAAKTSQGLQSGPKITHQEPEPGNLTKVGQRVQIVKDIPWSTANGAVATQPSVGLRGKIANSKKYPYPTPPAGHSAVWLLSTDLGYEEWDEDHKYQCRYIPTDCLKAI